MMNQRSFVALATEQIGPENRQWVEVMPTVGDADNGGKKFVITAEDLEVYAESIRKNPGKTVIDYDHEGAPGVGGSTKASGWFTGNSEVRETERGPVLFAEAQWTPPAAQAIRDGEYRFISAEFSLHGKGEDGVLRKAKDFIAATLTNRPFFRDLAPVTARLNDAQIDSIAAALEVDRDLVVAAAAAAPGPADGQPITQHEGEEMNLLSTLRARLKTADDATEEIVLAKLDEVLASEETAEETETEETDETKPEDEKTEEVDESESEVVETRLLKHSNEQLTARVKRLELEVAAREETANRERRDAAVAQALKDGRIMAAEHDMYRENLDINEEAALKVLASLPKGRVPIHERGAAPSQGTQTAELAWFPQYTNTPVKES